MRYCIYGNPVSKKNSSQMVFSKAKNRWFPVPSKAYKAFEADALKQLKANGEPIQSPVNIRYTFYMKTLRLVDGLNLSEAVDDILVKAKVLSDDNRDVVAGHDGTRVFYDKDNPRTEIEITELTDYEQWKKTQP